MGGKTKLLLSMVTSQHKCFLLGLHFSFSHSTSPPICILMLNEMVGSCIGDKSIHKALGLNL